MRVALFIACFNDLLYPEVGQATVRLLTRLGCQVEFPEAQTCCGQMHFNTGYRDECVSLARNFAAAFKGYDAVVTPSPSCASMVRHFYPTVAEHGRENGAEAGLPAALDAVSQHVYELSEFLIDILNVEDVGARFPHSVAFHPTCHSVRVLGIGDRPQRLLDHVEGLTRLTIADSDQCCGFGGTFAVKNADTSIAMGNDKVQRVLATGAEVLTAADTSCLMHLGGLLSRDGAPIKVMHLAQILAAQEGAA